MTIPITAAAAAAAAAAAVVVFSGGSSCGCMAPAEAEYLRPPSPQAARLRDDDYESRPAGDLLDSHRTARG